MTIKIMEDTILKKDISTMDDVKNMVDTFYGLVNNDELLSPIFNDFAHTDWPTHLPKMYGFWGKILLGEGEYSGAPFPPHIRLPIERMHFQRWLDLFIKNIDHQYSGPIAEEAIQRAQIIANTFMHKLAYIKQTAVHNIPQ
jgi:hemoglobin